MWHAIKTNVFPVPTEQEALAIGSAVQHEGFVSALERSEPSTSWAKDYKGNGDCGCDSMAAVKLKE